jgi:N utilization substance protein A
MANELLTILEYIEQERGINRSDLIKALEEAILIASRKSIHPASDLRVVIEPRTGQIQAWARLTVVEENPNKDQIAYERACERFPLVSVGEVVDWEVTPRDFGRIAAQTARQAIVQQIRRVEKENVLEEFADRVGQIINGTVRRFDGKNVIIDFQKAEGIMYAKETVHDEQYMPGDRINVLLQKVDINTSGPSLIVSRASADFISKLFEREVSEIHDGIVRIAACVREPGKRTKIAVASSDPRVDPVGACVGIRGTRVRRITDEFDNEKIDIIPYDEDIRKYAANALAPAKVQEVMVNEEKHELIITVSDEQQSKLAFGRGAQNVRLSARLIGWKISLRSSKAAESSSAPSIGEQLAAAAGKLAGNLGVSEATAQLLVDNGFVTVDGVKAADPAALAAIEGIDSDEITAAWERLANE